MGTLIGFVKINANMKNLIPLIIACAVAVTSSPVPQYVPGYPVMPYMPTLNSGGGYYNQDYMGGTGASRGGGYRNQGSNMYYNQGENHHRTKQVLESENSSRHNVGGGSQGSSSGGSFDRFNMFGRGGMNSGSGFSNYGPGYI